MLQASVFNEIQKSYQAAFETPSELEFGSSKRNKHVILDPCWFHGVAFALRESEGSFAGVFSRLLCV